MSTASDIHVITTFRYTPIPSDRNRWEPRSVGYFHNKEEAIKAVETNAGDIYERGYYEVAAVETLPEGIYPIAKTIEWFEWDDLEGGYLKIGSPPEGLEEVFGISLG